MIFAQNLWLFALLVFGIILVPGMDMLFVLSNTLTSGRSTGLMATAGIMLGGLVHTIAGALGVTILFEMAPWLFSALMVIGTLYMIWIGISLLRSTIRVADVPEAKRKSGLIAFRQGLLTCLVNPKAYLFVITVFPQFLRPQLGPIWLQASAFGLVTITAQLLVYGGLAVAASRSADFLIANPHATTLIGRLCGGLFLLLALWSGWHIWSSQAVTLIP